MSNDPESSLQSQGSLDAVDRFIHMLLPVPLAKDVGADSFRRPANRLALLRAKKSIAEGFVPLARIQRIACIRFEMKNVWGSSFE